MTCIPPSHVHWWRDGSIHELVPLLWKSMYTYQWVHGIHPHVRLVTTTHWPLVICQSWVNFPFSIRVTFLALCQPLLPPFSWWIRFRVGGSSCNGSFGCYSKVIKTAKRLLTLYHKPFLCHKYIIILMTIIYTLRVPSNQIDWNIV